MRIIWIALVAASAFSLGWYSHAYHLGMESEECLFLFDELRKLHPDYNDAPYPRRMM